MSDQPLDWELIQAQKLPPELMLLKMENESIMAIARTKPRESAKIIAQLKALVDAYPQSADDAIYVKPVGTCVQIVCANPKCKHTYEVSYVNKDVQCPKCECPKIGSQRKVKKFAEGLSIRAAESIRSLFGFNRLATTMEIQESGHARITGIFIDYAAGNITADERIVSPFYKSRGGEMQRTPEDRFINVVVKAEKSKLRRDVILDSVPNEVKAAFRDACEQKLAQLVTPEKIDKEVLPRFAEKGLTLEHLEKIIGRPKSLGWTQEDLLTLRNIWSALKNEETTVAELLADLEEKDEQQEQQQHETKAPSGASRAQALAQTTAGTRGATVPAVDSAKQDTEAPTDAQSKGPRTDATGPKQEPPPNTGQTSAARSQEPAQGDEAKKEEFLARIKQKFAAVKGQAERKKLYDEVLEKYELEATSRALIDGWNREAEQRLNAARKQSGQKQLM